MFFALPMFADIIVVEPLGIMVNIDQNLAQKQLGAAKLASIAWGCFTSFSLPSEKEVEEGLFYSLSQMPLPARINIPQSDVVTHYHQLIVPRVILAYYLGNNMLADAEKFLKNYEKKRYKSKAIHKTIKAIIPFSFDAKKQADILTLDQRNIALLQALKNKGHKIYILFGSNQAVLQAMLNKFPVIRQLISGSYCASQAQAFKPTKEIYEKFAKEFNLDLEQVYYVDPEPYHVEQMKQYGMKAYINIPSLPL